MPNASQACLDMQKHAQFFEHAHFACKKRKNIRSAVFQFNRLNNEKVTVNSKYCCEYQHTWNILIIFTYMSLLLMY